MVLEFLELGNLQFGEDGEDYIACCPDDEHLRAAWENFGWFKDIRADDSFGTVPCSDMDSFRDSWEDWQCPKAPWEDEQDPRIICLDKEISRGLYMMAKALEVAE